MLKTLYAALPVSSGVVKVHGKEISPRIPADAVKAGICMIPEERRKEGLELTMSVAYNLSMATLSKYAQNPMQFLDKKQERVDAVSKVEQLHIATPSIDQQVMFLSGGNQQKVVIGKWIGSDADVFIFDEPTQGIDVGAKQEVYKLCIDLARQGKAVIYCTSETGEILALTDRTYVMYDGQIQKEFNTAETNEQQILVYSTGGTT